MFFESLKIVLLAVAAAVGYGILHDQVTARVCVEYFTVGHPPVFNTTDPTLLAVGWGTIATWWVGAILGVPAALLAQIGPWPQVSARRLLRPILVLLATMAVVSLVSGVAGFWAARSGAIALSPGLAARIDPARHHAFLADAWAHLAAYGVGFLGGAVLWAWIALRRCAPAGTSPA